MQPLGPKQTEQLHTPPTVPLARSLLLMRNLLRVPRPHPGPKLACRVRRVRSLPLMRNLLRVPRPHPGPKLACRVRRARSLLLMRNLLRVLRPHPGPKLVCRVRRVLHRKRATPAKGERQNSEDSIQSGAGPLLGPHRLLLTGHTQGHREFRGKAPISSSSVDVEQN